MFPEATSAGHRYPLLFCVVFSRQLFFLFLSLTVGVLALSAALRTFQLLSFRVFPLFSSARLRAVHCVFWQFVTTMYHFLF